MINVYYGGADRNKDRFMFDMIMKQLPTDTILLVPDQFTLQAERNAFEYMKSDTLLELEIMSRSGFARRVIAQTGEPGGVAVNKYGRYMLLAGLMLKMKKENESIFAGVRNKRSFITMLNDQISELKQYDITPRELHEMAGELSDDEILKSKLEEIYDIYERYEAAVAGRFTDTEDHQQAVNEKAGSAPFVKRSIFWIDGFDLLTPKLISMVEAIAAAAVDVNVVLTGEPDAGRSGMGARSTDGVKNAEHVDMADIISGGDREFFGISRSMREQLRKAGERSGAGYHEYEIPVEYAVELRPEISVMGASDFYAEAESIAIDITKLVRERGYRYSDIVIICNDADKRGSVFRRVFDQYGIPLFIDRKRSITQEPGIAFIMAMLDIIKKKRRFDDVFRMLKTGFGPLIDDECEAMEKYCRKYNIRSGRWKKEFVYGLKDVGEERLAEINDMRRRVDNFLTAAEELFYGMTTVRQRCEALYMFLAQTADMPVRCEAARMRLEEDELYEAAQSTAQVWDTVVGILDQLVEVIGDEEISDDDFNEILAEGFEEVEIGLIPPNNDQVIFGTMQRTRTGGVRAMFVAGANDGVLPEAGRTESLLSDEEKQLITDKLKRISKTDELRVMEQNLAIYKNLTKAGKILSISYAEMDVDGSEIRPSELVEELLRSAKNGSTVDADADDKLAVDDTEAGRIAVRRDYISIRDTDAMLQTAGAASGHVTSALRKYLNGEPLEDEWKAAALALDEEISFKTAQKALFYNSESERIKREQVKQLFGRGSSEELIVSTSGLERYSRCPFSFFVTYGLKPEEERRFEADMRSIGDIYHECMRRVADALTQEGVQISAPESRWMSVTKEQCRSMTARYVEEFSERYREGLFQLTGREAYIRERIKEICFETAWLMIEQVKRGKVKAIYFEQRFARRADALFPPIEINLGDEGSVFIEGVIDRIDIINGNEEFRNEDDKNEESRNNEANAQNTAAVTGETERNAEQMTGEIRHPHNYIRVIDYKSGSEKFNLEEVKSGWRLQLMLYLKGAMGAVEDSRPAGVFYFAVKEPRIDVSTVSESEVDETVSTSLLKSVRLDGALLNNESVITGMDCSIEGTSEILPVRRTSTGKYTGANLLTDAEFEELIRINDDNLRNAAADLISGCIDADPKSSKTSTACKYCAYHSICGYE